jgi:FAS-associated factor 2
MAEERKKNEEEAEKERLELEKVQRKLKRVAWRRWARRALVGTEDTTSAGIRIGVRLPDGRRIIRRFSPKDSLTSLYAFVDTQFIGADSPAESDPEQPPEGYVNEWEFKLVTTYPRQEIEKDVGGKAIGEVEGLGHGANLVVEMTRAADEVIEGSDEEE